MTDVWLHGLQGAAIAVVVMVVFWDWPFWRWLILILALNAVVLTAMWLVRGGS